MAIDGPNVVSDTPAPPTEAQSATTSSAPKPGFPTLARTPSSAFVSASKEGRINPLTLHAIARRDSEQEAIRLVHERKETERRREDSTQSTVRGGAGGGIGSPPQTPTQPQQLNHRSSLRGILSNSPARSESPARLTDDERAKLKKPRPTGLGRVIQDDTRSVGTSSSGPGFPRSATMSSTASGSRFSLHQPRASTSRGVPDRHRAVSEAHSLAPSEGDGDEPDRKKKKKPGFFSRFGKKNRSAPPPPPLPNSPTSVRDQDSDFDTTIPHSPLSEMTPPRSGAAHPTAPAEKIRIVKVKCSPSSHPATFPSETDSASSFTRSARKENLTKTLADFSSRKNSSSNRPSRARNGPRSVLRATTSQSILRHWGTQPRFIPRRAGARRKNLRLLVRQHRGKRTQFGRPSFPRTASTLRWAAKTALSEVRAGWVLAQAPPSS